MDDIEEGWTKRVALDGAATINVFPILVPQPFLLPVTDRSMVLKAGRILSSPHVSQSSTARPNTGAGAGIAGFATLQGVDPASAANRHETRTSTRSSIARHEFCETCGLVWCIVNSFTQTVNFFQGYPKGSNVENRISLHYSHRELIGMALVVGRSGIG